MNLSFYKGRHLISASDLDFLTKQQIFSETLEIKRLYENADGKKALKRILRKDGQPLRFLLLFWEASTRTVLSFQRAISILGGHHETIYDAGKFSSAAKGETIRSTIRILGPAYDCIIMRHDCKEDPEALKTAVDTCGEYGLETSIINAGDGKGEHPTQMLLDLFTVWELRRKEFENGELNYAFVGDLRDSRTIHSCLFGLQDYGAKKIYLISSINNNLPEWLTEKVFLPMEKVIDICPVASEVNVWYFTRYQRGRKGDKCDCKTVTKREIKYAENYGVTDMLLSLMKKNAIVLHPLPHGPEYPLRVDVKDARFIHYNQADNGFYVRMALLKLLFARDVDLKIAEAEEKTVKIYGQVADLEISIRSIAAVCAGGNCAAVRMPGGWVKVSSMEEKEIIHKLGKAYVICPECGPRF